MNNEIGFERSKITAVEHKIGSGGVSSRIKVVAIATAKIAKAIGARWLLDRDALVKQGFTSVELDYVLKGVRFKHSIDKVASLEVVSELVTKFKVFRKGDDAKKSKRLMVSFQVHHSGSPFELLEHLMKVGEGEGMCTLTAMQAEMFPAGNGDAKPKKNGNQSALVKQKKAEPKEGGETPNAEGVFMSVKATLRYKGKDKRFHAELFVVEVEDGFLSGYKVQAGLSGRAHMPSLAMPRHASKEAAVASAAGVVLEVAQPRGQYWRAGHKREAEQMVTWAKSWASAMSPPESGVLEGLVEEAEAPRTGKDASYPD